MSKLIVESKDLEELEIALESIIPLFLDGYKGGTTQNGCNWDLEDN